MSPWIGNIIFVLGFVASVVIRIPHDKVSQKTKIEESRKDLLEKGQKAGCDQVVSRSVFSQHLGDIVMKYALPGGVRAEEDEAELPEE